MGRDVLGYGEITRMRFVENVALMYRAREQSTSWATWARENPDAASILNEAERLYNGRC